MTVDLEAFADELEKIAAAGPWVRKAIETAKRVKPGHLKYPAVAVGAITAADLAEMAKRRYDIGKAYEESQGM